MIRPLALFDMCICNIRISADSAVVTAIAGTCFSFLTSEIEFVLLLAVLENYVLPMG